MQERKRQFLDLIHDEPYKIGHVLGFRDLNEYNNQWIKDMIFNEEDETILAHRGSYKTTCVALSFALIMVIYPSRNIIFTRKTDDDVKEVIKQVAKILKSSLFNEIVNVLYGVDICLIEENATSITTNLMVGNKGNSQLLGLGIKTSLTGKHSHYVFTDDIVNIKDRISRAERELIKVQYQELQNIKNRGGKIFNTGTKWHKDDAIELLMPNKKIYDCYSTGLISKEQIEMLRSSMTPSLFSANYELKHIADVDALFGTPTFTNDYKLIEQGICHIDASYGGKDGTAFTMCKKVNDKYYVLGKRWNKHVDECINEILLLKKQYKIGTTFCEDNGDKGYLKKELRSRGDFCKTYHESTNKYIKISSYLKRYYNDIIFLDNTDNDYLNEILDYTENAEHDDAPDSCASIIRQLNNNGWIV